MTKPAAVVAVCIAAVLGTGIAVAQTCSCAAVPLLGSMQNTPTNEGQWYLGTSYEFHDVSELVAGSSTVPDTTFRERTTSSMIIEASRGLTDKWSLSALISGIEHEREVGGEFVSASGLGDGLVIARYSVRNISLYSDSALAFGVGVRAALGDDAATRDGVALAEDMHPSTGAHGGILMAYWARALNDAGSTQIYLSGSYGTYGANDRNYRFGNEVNLAFGSTIQGRGRWGFNLELAMRDAERDRRNASEISNTGGRWLDLNAAVQYRLNESLGISFGGSIPVDRDLHDQLQFTTKYAARAAVSYVFGGDL